MDSSLTVVLPINNAERTLRRDVVDVLEAAAELTALFEVLIVDDGSTDDSYDVAVELAMAYRQVRVMRRSRRKGLTESLREIQATELPPPTIPGYTDLIEIGRGGQGTVYRARQRSTDRDRG